MNILDKIVQHKQIEIKTHRLQPPLFDDKQLKSPNDYSLIEQIKNNRYLSVIAEIKKGSPSKGLFAEHLNVIEQAKYYEDHGASSISVLTDHAFFYGGFDVLQNVRRHVDLPLLCKDFIIDDIQIKMAKHYGANVLLLIKRILTIEQFEHLLNTAKSYHLEVLVEVDSLEEFMSIASMDFQLCGVNNRNLEDFSVSINKTKMLAHTIKKYGKLLVSESGIHCVEQMRDLRTYDIDGVLVGEHLIKDTSQHLLKDLQILKEQTQIKICGLQELEHVLILDLLKVDFIGFVFAKSKRNVSIAQAKKLIAPIKHAATVGVFMNQSVQYIEKAYHGCHLDYVQVHGDFDFDALNIPKSKVIRAIPYTDSHPSDFPILLIDGQKPGDGNTYDLSHVINLSGHTYMLAGGLNSQNVVERVHQFPCTVVDVSSGVESDGRKNLNKMETFIKKVRGL